MKRERTSFDAIMENSLYENVQKYSILNRLEQTTDPNSIGEIVFNAENRKQKFNVKSNAVVYVKDGVVRKVKEYKVTKRNPARFWWL